VEEASKLMRFIYENPDDAAARGRKAKLDLQKHFSETAVAELMKARLLVINAESRFKAIRQKWQNREMVSRDSLYRRLIRRIRALVQERLPIDSTVIVVNKGDDALLRFRSRHGWHFPQRPDGSYAGHYPADGAEAIASLESVRHKGGQFLLIPNTAFWWLDYYRELREHLESKYKVVAREDACVLFDLCARKSKTR
jgi:hypothetical protein